MKCETNNILFLQIKKSRGEEFCQHLNYKHNLFVLYILKRLNKLEQAHAGKIGASHLQKRFCYENSSSVLFTVSRSW